MKQSKYVRHSVGRTASKLLILIGQYLGVYLMYAVFCLSFARLAAAQQPSEPVDISPIDGEVYYIVN